MKTFNLLIMLFLMSTFMFCIKEAIPTNVVTTVNGFVIDSTKNKRLSKANIVIYGCGKTFYGVYCTDSITTATTNSDGEFSVKFNSDGKSIRFTAELIPDENYNYSSTVDLNTGTTNNIKIVAREYNFLKTHLNIKNNPFDTLVCLSGNVRHIFYGRSIDTNVINRVLPNSINYVIYSAWDRNVGRYRQLIDTLQIDSRDTIIYNRTLPDISTFKLN